MKAKTFTVPFGSSGFNSVADLAECLANQTDPVAPPPSTPRRREIAWIACVAQLDEGPRAFLVRPKSGVIWHELADAQPQNWDATALTDQETLSHGLDGYVAQVRDSSPDALATIPRMPNGWFRSTCWNAVTPWDEYDARETLNGMKRIEWADRLWDSIEDSSLPAMVESGEAWRPKDQCDGDATYIHFEHLKQWFAKHEPFIELAQEERVSDTVKGAGEGYDQNCLATKAELLVAFRGYLKSDWFDKVKDRDWLAKARKEKGVGGLGTTPLFCPYEVMIGLQTKIQGRRLPTAEGWRRLRQYFSDAYVKFEHGDPTQ